MKTNIKLFIGVCLFSSVFIFIGSILGDALGQAGLFMGAFIGGIFGVILSVLFLLKLKVVHRDSFSSTITWGITFFGTASLFAVTNLTTPVIPLLSVLFIGLGCIIGNSFKPGKQGNKQFYFSLLGFLLIIPTLYFVVGSILKYNLGFSHSFSLLDWLVSSPSRSQKFNFISPFIFIGGTILSFFLNIPLRVKINSENLISFRYTSSSKLNLVIALISALLLSILLLYVALENF